MLKVNAVNVFHGDVQCLWDVSIEVNSSEMVAMVGPNGAGKTSLLRTVSGALHPRAGTIEFAGKRIDALPMHKISEMGIGHVPEGRRIFSYMTTLENLELGAYNKVARREKKETLEKVLQMFPVLAERKKQLAGTLSGGEQQMLAVGRALMSRPKLLILDEPSSGLAPIITLRLFETVKNLREREDVAVLIVEQNVQQALEIADRAYLIETGRIAREGRGKDLLEDGYLKTAYLGL